MSAAHRPLATHPASIPHYAAHYRPRSSAPAMLHHICFALCLAGDRAQCCHPYDPGSTACLSTTNLEHKRCGGADVSWILPLPDC